MAGAAVGVAAAAWLGKRRSTSLRSVGPAHVEPEARELPMERRAEPEIDGPLLRVPHVADAASGAAQRSAADRLANRLTTNASLDEIWNSLPLAQGDQGEAYDAVAPEIAEVDVEIAEDEVDVEIAEDEDEIAEDELDLK